MSPRTYPSRISRRRLGIPDAHDALAIYLRWVRQAHYLRANNGPEMAWSVMAVGASHYNQVMPPAAVPRTMVNVELDVTGVGAWADAGRIEGYPVELDILG